MSQAELSIEQVAEFLREYPDFFEQHPDVLLNIEVPHPHGGRTVSIPERQLIATRERGACWSLNLLSSSSLVKKMMHCQTVSMR